MAEMWDLRQSLETYANGRAARRITGPQITELRTLVFRLRTISRQMVDQNEYSGPLFRELAVTDAAFHLVLLDAAACSRTAKIISDLRLLAQRFTSRRLQTAWNLARAQRWHWRIYQAVRQHDVRAARKSTATSIRETKRIELQLYDRHELQRLPESQTQSMWREAVKWAEQHRIDVPHAATGSDQDVAVEIEQLRDSTK
jgi:DNA-binding GntR family transcriptional regulator